MKVNYSIEERVDGRFIVMEEVVCSRPWWKFWGPKTEWKPLRKKDGSICAYDSYGKAKSVVVLKGGNLCQR